MAAADDEQDGRCDPDADGQPHAALLHRRRQVAACGRRPLETVLVGIAQLSSHERGEASAPPHLEVADLGIRDRTKRLDGGALGPDRREITQISGPGMGEVAGLAGPTDHQRGQHLDHGDDGHLREHTQQMEGRVAREHRAHPVEVLEPPPVLHGLAIAESFHVTHHGIGGDHHTRTGEVGLPAQGEVVVVVVDRRVEAADGLEQVAADQRDRAGNDVDVTDGIVLFLIELVAVDQRCSGPGLVDGFADAEQATAVAPGDQLGADDPGIGAKGLLDEHSNRPGRQRHVVVAAQIEVGAVDHVHRLVDGPPEPDVVVEAPNERIGEVLRHSRSGVDLARRIDDEDSEIGVVLARQRRHRLVEPHTRVTGHDDGDDRRRSGGRGLHDATTVVPHDRRAVHARKVRRPGEAGCGGFSAATYRCGVSDPPADRLVNAAKDSLYVSVGLGVIAFQRAQVRRHELSNGAEPVGLAKLIGDNLKMADERLQDAEERIDAVLDEVETRLPPPARDAMAAARSAAREARDTVRKLL